VQAAPLMLRVVMSAAVIVGMLMVRRLIHDLS
jgi:hypothetical protein